MAQLRDANGERPLDWRLKRSFQILAFLGSSPELQATREKLIEAIWPTEGERTIERNFHPTLSHLRRALEGDRKGNGPAPLLFRNGIYRLNPEITWEIDVLDFDRHVEAGKGQAARQEFQAAAESWGAAWKLYRGPFLQGHYEAWLTERREVYQRQYLEMLRDLGDVQVRLGRTEEAMDAYRSVLLEDPLQEKVHLSVMHLYAGQGRRDLVRRQYDRLCVLLLEELGVEPMEQTTREYHKLMG
jgi:DNA-binding SARP family transcriptional activator